MSSLDSTRFEPVRTCGVERRIAFDNGKEALAVGDDPVVTGQDFGRGGDDNSVVVLSARHEGAGLDPISEFPCFVHISASRQGWTDLSTPIRADDLEILGWGELYRTAEDARAHRFD